MGLKVNVGSKNQAKVAAAREILKEYPHLKVVSVKGVEVSSGVSNQPTSLNEAIEGAMNRAKAAYRNCDYAIGIESGLMEVPHTKSGYMDVCVCAIYDKQEFHIGLSSAWEFPNKEIMEMIVRDGLDMSQAINKAGLTSDPKIGSKEGAIGILTKGRISRKEYTKQALRMALIHLEKFDF